MTLGYNGTNANVTSDATKVPSIQLAGTAAYSGATASSFTVLIESNVGYLTFGVQNGSTSGLTKANGSAIASSTFGINFFAAVPISGW